MKQITLDNLNAKDLYNLFSTLYKEKHGVDYEGVGFIGNEMHKLKNSIEEHGSAHVACAILNCINRNDRTVSVPYFTAGARYYMVPDNPEIYWSIKRYGTPKMKKLWREYMFLDSVWLPTATKRQRLKEVIKQLREWAYAKTGKKTRTSNTKTKEQKP
jgi:hypothetical protein